MRHSAWGCTLECFDGIDECEFEEMFEKLEKGGERDFSTTKGKVHVKVEKIDESASQLLDWS